MVVLCFAAIPRGLPLRGPFDKLRASPRPDPSGLVVGAPDVSETIARRGMGVAARLPRRLPCGAAALLRPPLGSSQTLVVPGRCSCVSYTYQGAQGHGVTG